MNNCVSSWYLTQSNVYNVIKFFWKSIFFYKTLMQIFTMWGFWIIVLHLGIWHKVIFQAGEQLFVWGNRPTDKIPPDLRFSGVSFYISQDLSFYFSRVSFYISLTFRYLYFLWQGINQFKAFSEKPKVLWWLQSLPSCKSNIWTMTQAKYISTFQH